MNVRFKTTMRPIVGLLCKQATALVLLLTAALVVADDQPPSEPASLESIRYSSTAGEIFWTAATDNELVVGYRVVRDGELLGIRDARSVFETGLVPGQTYTYEVSALDHQGNEGIAQVVKLSGVRGTTLNGSVQGTPPDELQDPPGPTITDPSSSTDDGGLILYSSSGRATLLEGDSAGISIGLSVQRTLAQKRTVTLSLEADASRDFNELDHVFSSTSLAPDESGSVLTLRLDIGVAPLILHERYFRLVADDGVSRTSTQLVIDVTPTALPDVYLLAGQSNMEGYSEVGSRQRFPGGLDERRERIKQLNVRPNSRSIFNDNSIFSDEQANIASPMFVPAEDPLHEPRNIGIDGKGATFVGLGLTFAKEALRTSTADIYLVPAAWGATGFCANSKGDLAWNAEATEEDFLGGTLLTERALTRLNLTLRETGGILRGILWHQGGADSNNPDCARTYSSNLQALAQRLRRDARQDARGPSARGNDAVVPFIVATQSRGDDERANFSIYNPSKVQVDSVHRSVAEFVPYSDFVNNDDLVPPQYPCGQVSCVHFGAAALREQGRRFYAALKRIWSAEGAYHF
ncbi:MAG: sialate O-acetylesterase [Granulosicoccus sp.]